MLNIVIERNLKSYQFKVNPKLPSSFSNNYKNNSIDWKVYTFVKKSNPLSEKTFFFYLINSSMFEDNLQ